MRFLLISLFIFQANLFLNNCDQDAIDQLLKNVQAVQANITARSALKVHIYSSAHRVQTTLVLCQL